MAQIVEAEVSSKSKSIPITGIGNKGIGPKGELPLRRDIDDWWFSQTENDALQRSLYIYAMHAFQQRGLDNPKVSDPLSYVSIAGRSREEQMRLGELTVFRNPWCSAGCMAESKRARSS